MQPTTPHAPLPTHDKNPRLILVDGSGYIFRAYHALPPLTRKDGTAVGAVYGFTTMLLNLREQYAEDYLVVIFDASRKSFRNEFYADYKAHRPDPPEDLIPQFALVREATRALKIPAIEMENFEADDLIASYATAGRQQGMEVLIISSDKDLMQLICEGVSMWDPMKKKPIGEAEVMEKFGVHPCKVIEVQALIGDSVDNVPGVPSIGPKTAAELINAYGDVEGVLANLANIKQPKRREVLTQHADAARISRRLVELRHDVPLPTPVETFDLVPLDNTALFEFLEAQNFTSLAKKMGAASAHAPFAQEHAVSSAPSQKAPTAAQATAAVAPVKVAYETVRDEASLARWIAQAQAAGYVAIDTETTSLNAVEAELVGISLATEAGRACYIPVGHVTEGAAAQGGLFDAPTGGGATRLADGQLPRDRVLALLAPLLADPAVLKIGHNLKYDLVVLAKYGASMQPVADTMLMSYCLFAGLHGHGMDYLCETYLNHKMIAYTDVVGTGRAQKNFSEIDIDRATAYAAEDADFTFRMYEYFLPQLAQKQVTRVYEEIERPLIPIIADMEVAGILVDTKKLVELSQLFGTNIAALEKEVFALAGTEFTIGSPKQLGEVLFDKLQLPGGKKSAKSGAYGTDVQVLEELAEQGQPIARKVLEWRQYSKLKSTYTDALANAISPRDARVHTSFSMAIAATGRLSSTDPNLQNIPIRTEEGRKIREAFVAPEGFTLLSADYSQIELRLLAHVADIPVLRDAFRNGTDIHAVTASQMFGVPVAEVTSELRRRAKTINFGIIYGISAHGLSTRLGIDRKEAADYIGRYFEQYPGIREYMDRTIQFAREHGYVTTLDGRRIHVKDINSKNGAFRQFSERAAINAPLQGSAADIIKRAMASVHALLKQEGDCRLLLQVHDELVIEAPQAKAEQLKPRVKAAMESVMQLSVPLTVEVGQGRTWGESH
ncbi:MAG: DNA polymerase I [Azospirillum brasilense]|nr:MAG: DNA polymerase I [Azospirillum brasilense]